eukprot:1144798-Pelagomonas_calceolata.AAC.1
MVWLRCSLSSAVGRIPAVSGKRVMACPCMRFVFRAGHSELFSLLSNFLIFFSGCKYTKSCPLLATNHVHGHVPEIALFLAVGHPEFGTLVHIRGKEQLNKPHRLIIPCTHAHPFCLRPVRT